jgi:hypothetical protein
MLGTEPMPTLLACLMLSKSVTPVLLLFTSSISPEAHIHVTNEHDGPRGVNSRALTQRLAVPPASCTLKSDIMEILLAPVFLNPTKGYSWP